MKRQVDVRGTLRRSSLGRPELPGTLAQIQRILDPWRFAAKRQNVVGPNGRLDGTLMGSGDL